VRFGQGLRNDDNVYRLPAAIDPADLLGPAARRDDLIKTSSVALDGRWQRGEQTVVLDTGLAAHRFTHNDDLDNTSGNAGLSWDWRFGGKWSGQLDGRRERSLASFANTTSLAKDVFDVVAYEGEARFDVGPRWRASLSARDAVTTHGDETRRGDDVAIENAAIGLHYHTPRSDNLGWKYHRARASHHIAGAPAAARSASDYDERGASFELRYLLSQKVQVEGSIGYLERTYPYAARGDFSGDVWSVALQWSATVKTQLALQRWHELKAHFDAEADHFISTGSGLVASWVPRDRLRIALQVAREQQRYIGAAAEPAGGSLRYDEPRTRSLRLTYTPRERVSLDVAYRRETRDSNRLRFDYAAEVLSVAYELKF
jgi:hypothetical protein